MQEIISKKTPPSRQSNFELLRIVCMFFIVFYHLLLFGLSDTDKSGIFMPLYIPLHISVLCFVLISGYFHINPTVKGAVKLLLPLLLFYLPLTLFDIFMSFEETKSLLFFSHSPYWFIRTYFYLFLIAPILNKWLDSVSHGVYALIVLCFISIYMGMMKDPSLIDGKNLSFFMFLYCLGDFIRKKEETINKIGFKCLLCVYIVFNLLIVFGYAKSSTSIVGTVLWALSYPYCSPLLVVNAVLFFLIFTKISIVSKFINSVASSVFAIYIVHHQFYILYFVTIPIVHKMYYLPYLNDSPFLLLLSLSFLTLGIMFFCILLDKIFMPFSNSIVGCVSSILNNTINKFKFKV